MSLIQSVYSRALIFVTLSISLIGVTSSLESQEVGETDMVGEIVARLNLDSYKNTIKGLTQFGDRRQGTDRNLAAVDWIEDQLVS